MIRLLFILSIIVTPFLIDAQTDTTSNQGRIISGEVIIEKDKEIILPVADKIYKKGSLLDLGNQAIAVELTASEPKLEWPPYNTSIPFTRIKSEYPVDEFSNYLKLGYGNYASPLVALGIFEHVGSFYLKNKFLFESFSSGPVEGSNSANSIGELNLSAAYQAKKIEIAPYLNFSNQNYRFYGNTDRMNPEFNSLELPRIGWSKFEIGTELSGILENIEYRIDPHFTSSYQKPENAASINKENEFGAIGSMKIKMDRKWDAEFLLEAYSAEYAGGISYNRSLVSVKPRVEYKNDNYLVSAGLTVASNKVGEENFSRVYPDIKGLLQLSPNWDATAHLKGGIAWQNLSSLIDENQFMDDSLLIRNTENELSIGGGLKGSLTKNIEVNIGLSFDNISNIPFYVPSSSDSSKYTITYDEGSTQRIQLLASLEYLHSPNAIYIASFELNSYSMENLERPWHLPLYTLKAQSNHSILERVTISSSILVLGGIKAPTTLDFGIESLKPIVDIGLDLNYKIDKRFSAFMKTSNLINSEYERYLGYPVRGVTFKIGGQYRF